jgi:hypothetical protein
MNESEQKIAALQKRIKELEDALRPFAVASLGFSDGAEYLEYLETDGTYCKLFTDDEALSPLMIQHLLEAARVLPLV